MVNRRDSERAGSGATVRREMRRRDFVAGSLAGGTALMAGANAWAQAGPTIPIVCVPPGAVHCWYCSGALDGLSGIEIHGGWWFLAWHRAYLYFHEQILGTLIGDPTFALPYWDWDSCTDDPNDVTGRNRFPGEVFGFEGDTTSTVAQGL